MSKIKLKTVCCVLCGKPAKFWTGYVLGKNGPILAGWCSRRHAKDKGFSGHLQEWMPTEGVTP